jgi:hypothetical protein
MTKGFFEQAVEAARPEIGKMISREVIREISGPDRISLADFTGKFIDLEPWQRELVETIAAIPPDQRDKVLIIDGPGQRVRGWDLAANRNNMGEAVILGMDFDRILIDDPWDEPAAKLAEAMKFERMHALDNARYPGKMIEPKPRKLGQAARLDPINRADRRAQLARDRKARR